MQPQIERFRPMITSGCPEAACSGYPFENRRNISLRPSAIEKKRHFDDIFAQINGITFTKL
jgi:hypothetical protein